MYTAVPSGLTAIESTLFGLAPAVNAVSAPVVALNPAAPSTTVDCPAPAPVPTLPKSPTA